MIMASVQVLSPPGESSLLSETGIAARSGIATLQDPPRSDVWSPTGILDGRDAEEWQTDALGQIDAFLKAIAIR
jgi:hypothetical protein